MGEVENQLQRKPQQSELAKEPVIERQRKDYMKPGFSWHRTYRGCFFDEGKLVILLNGFQKKTQKTPIKEIEKAGTKKVISQNLKMEKEIISCRP